jgi:photosystem II stability/assembly factor-like uncharacterized protein
LRVKIWIGILACLGLAAIACAQKWQRLGPEGGMVVSLGAGPGAVVYLGTADGHVFVSEDAGKRWELRGRVGTRTDAVVARLAFDRREAGRIIAAVWYQEPGAGGGVFQSRDGGRTWVLVGLPQETVRALEIAPGDQNEVVAGTRSGIFRSRDAGRSWDRISAAGDEELKNVDSVAIDPRDGNVIYAGTYHLPWKTTDGGNSWQPVTAGLIDDSDIMSLRVDASDPERLYLSACSGIYRSDNEGGIWTKLQGIPYAARRTHAIVQDPQKPETLYAATTEGLWVTRDAGESWQRTTPKDWVVNSVVVLPEANGGHGRVVVGTEAQGVLVSEDAGESFAESNAGFTHRVVSELVGDPRQLDHLLLVAQIAGPELRESRDGGQNWFPLDLPKSGPAKANRLDAEMVEQIVGSPWGWLAKLRNGQLWLRDEKESVWKEWKLRLPARPASNMKSAGAGKRPAPPAMLKLTGKSLALASGYLYAITAEGLVRCQPEGSCQRLRAFGRTLDVRTIWVSSEGRLVNVLADGKLGTSNDRGETAVWHDIPLPASGIRWIFNLTTSTGNSVFLGTDDGLYESKDGGARWERHEAGLPAGQIEGWLWTESFLMTTLREGGMYLSRDSGRTWERVDQDAERGPFTGLVETGPGVVAVGSQSEGVLRVQIKGSQ